MRWIRQPRSENRSPDSSFAAACVVGVWGSWNWCCFNGFSEPSQGLRFWLSTQVGVDWNRNIFTTWSWSPPQKKDPSGWFMKRRCYLRIITCLLEDHPASLGSIETSLYTILWYLIMSIYELIFSLMSTCTTCSASEKRLNLSNNLSNESRLS